jgi:hypothetical protein
MELRTFGERLFWARRNHARITQLQLRDRMEEECKVKIGRNYISELETTADFDSEDSKQPTFRVVRAMAAAMKISLDYLAGFTDNLTPAQGEEPAPQYFSPEADEVAQLVDRMNAEQRAVVVSVARNLAVLTTERARRQAESKDVIASVEKELGHDARVAYERILRNKGLFVNNGS